MNCDGFPSFEVFAPMQLWTAFFQDVSTAFCQDISTAFLQDISTAFLQDISTVFFQDVSTSFFQDVSTAFFQDISTAFFQDISTAFFQDISTAFFQDISTLENEAYISRNSAFRGSVNEVFTLKGRYPTLIGSQFLTFRDSLSVPSSKVKQPKKTDYFAIEGGTTRLFRNVGN